MLAKDGCRDAANVDVDLLLEDGPLSDHRSLTAKGPGFAARLCAHHAQVYQADILGRACSQPGCRHVAQGRGSGPPTCGDHAPGSLSGPGAPSAAGRASGRARSSERGTPGRSRSPHARLASPPPAAAPTEEAREWIVYLRQSTEPLVPESFYGFTAQEVEVSPVATLFHLEALGCDVSIPV